MTSQAFQIPRNSLAWMLFAYVAVIAPHVFWMPIWISVTAIFALFWRIQVHRGLWRFPPRWFKYLLSLFSVAGLVLGFKHLAGLEPMVALLIIGFSLKLLEMHKRRDALSVIYLAYFIAAAALLFHQTILMAAYVTIAIILVTTALMGLNQSQGYRYPLSSLRLTSKLVLQSLPLMLLLFIVMPRLGPLWQVPLQQNKATTGVSDSMSPGDFNSLGKSGALAFRATFKDKVPRPSDLYWRGLVFSKFDGRKWTQADPGDYLRSGRIVRWSNEARQPWENFIEKQGAPVTYDIILEPTQQIWLYALATPDSNDQDTGLTQDFNLVSKRPIQTRLKYGVTSYLNHRTERTGLPHWSYQNETQLPANYNPKAVSLARRLRSEVASDQAYIQRVLTWINREFTYTLEPPLLGENTVDDFLFDTKQGFCEHFASSFTVMMRAAGIPARVVAGYQGGEVNPYQNYLLVHQFDAHAWTEVWLKGEGWVRVDPTAAVAPERIENGFQDFFSKDESFSADTPLSLIRFNNVDLVNKLRLQWDRVNYAWHRWVLGYDSSLQTDFLTKLLGNTDPIRIAATFFFFSVLILVVIGLRLVLQTRKPPVSPSIKAYAQFCRALRPLGIDRQAGEAPKTFLKRIVQLRPDLEIEAERITVLFEHSEYQKHDTEGAEYLEDLTSAVRLFTPRKKRLADCK